MKRAFFGTPANLADDTIYDIEADDEREEENRGETLGKDVPAPQPGNMSPTKLTGILMTPGTATSRRKTVSFGNDTVDKKNSPEEGGEGAKTRISSRRRASNRASRKSPLTQKLEDAREGGSSKTAPVIQQEESKAQVNVEARGARSVAEKFEIVSTKAKKPKKDNQQLLQEMAAESVHQHHHQHQADVTLDLSEPRSQSGKYWKEQFQTYHDDAKAELAALLKYKYLARSYAKEKDDKALDLHQKLKEEQRKVARMEYKISQLSARISTAGFETLDDDSPELIKELAKQTAHALHYKAQVEEFRKALEENGGSPVKRNSQDGRAITSPRHELTLLDTQSELRKARDELREMSSIRKELDSTQEALSSSTKTIRKLQDENNKLTQELLHSDLRLEKQVEKIEKRRQSAEEQRHRKEEALKTLQRDYDDLKERAKSQRRDAEQLLKGRHEQVIGLKKEIASLRGAGSTVKDFELALQKKTEEHERIVADMQNEIASLKAKRGQEDINASKIDSMPLPPRKVAVSKEFSQSQSRAQARESHIPISNSPTRPLKTVVSARQLRSDTPAGSPLPRSSHSALSEIVNHATADMLPPRTSGPVQYTPLARRFSDLSLDSPKIDLPPHDSLPSRAIHDRHCRPSPMPSMFNIPSSPPKPVMMRTRTSGDLARQRSSNDILGRQTNMSSSHMSDGSRARGNLPPERLAAAKARLEQKTAEKKAKLDGQKENIRE